MVGELRVLKYLLFFDFFFKQLLKIFFSKLDFVIGAVHDVHDVHAAIQIHHFPLHFQDNHAQNTLLGSILVF